MTKDTQEESMIYSFYMLILVLFLFAGNENY